MGSRARPTVSIIVLTAMGALHLRECLGALCDQTYPRELIEVIVVDNGSLVDPTPDVRRDYPDARVIRNGDNLGFAAGNNVGAKHATGDFVVFLNDDTRAHPDWLHELMSTVARENATAVASCIVDWFGTRSDFVDGAVSFQGKGFQLDYDTPIDRVTMKEKPLLFACGCAMLIDRAVFLESGGFDEGAFAYYEDVELGWRLNLLGHAIWFSPKAVVRHKHHGTSGAWPAAPKIRLLERNALRMLYRLLERETLGRVLPAALLLAADRALLSTGLSRASDPTDAAWTNESRVTRLLTPVKERLRSKGITRKTGVFQAIKLFVSDNSAHASSSDQHLHLRSAYIVEQSKLAAPNADGSEMISVDAAAILSAIYAFLAAIPELSQEREWLQRRREIPDREMLRRFGDRWLEPSPSRFQDRHNALQRTIVSFFRLDEDERGAVQ